MTLEVGDIICTGTPGGVGQARKPTILDETRRHCTSVEIEGLGVLRKSNCE